MDALISEHGIEKVKSGIACTVDNIKRGKMKENTGGFFIKAVQQGWKSGDQVKQERGEESQRKRAVAKEAQDQTEAIFKNQLKTYETWKSDLANSRFEALEEEKKINLKEKFVADFQHDPVFSRAYHSNGFENRIVQAYWVKFLTPILLSSEENDFAQFEQKSTMLKTA